MKYTTHYTHYTATFTQFCNVPNYWRIRLINVNTGELREYKASLASVFRIAQLLPNL